MFKKTHRNIYISLILPAFLLVVLTIVISGAMVSNMLYDLYVSMARQKLDRGISSCKNYVNSVMFSIDSLAENREILSELTQSTGNSLTAALDNAGDYTLAINAITVYAADGRIYTSSNISGVPTLNEFAENQRFSDFFTLDNLEYVSLRKNLTAQSYNGAGYPADTGMVTCCRKVYGAGNTLLGYIFADIFPSALYRYFNYADDVNFAGSLALIRFDETYFPPAGSEAYAQDFAGADNGNFRSADSRYLVISNNRNFYGGNVRIAVPVRPISLTIWVVVGVLAGFSAAALIGVHLIARHLAGSVNRRLTNLLRKMETTGAADSRP